MVVETYVIQGLDRFLSCSLGKAMLQAHKKLKNCQKKDLTTLVALTMLITDPMVM
jgi:hypothetical protein